MGLKQQLRYESVKKKRKEYLLSYLQKKMEKLDSLAEKLAEQQSPGKNVTEEFSSCERNKLFVHFFVLDGGDKKSLATEKIKLPSGYVYLSGFGSDCFKFRYSKIFKKSCEFELIFRIT